MVYNPLVDLQKRVERALKEEEEANVRRKERNKETKRIKKAEENAALAEQQDEQVAALMGFGGFGTSKK